MPRALALVCVVMIILAGCAGSMPSSNDASGEKGSSVVLNEDLYSIRINTDYTYNYEIKDRAGKVLLSDKNIPRQPSVTEAGANLLKLSVQTGTGKSSEWARYCDVEKGVASDVFYYVLAETEDKVVCVEFYDKYNVVIRDMFSKETIYGGTVLDDAYPFEPVMESELLENNKLRIVYLKDDGVEEEEIFITID